MQKSVIAINRIREGLASACSVENLSADDFTLKLSAQMARPELTQAHSNEQLLSL